MFIDDVFLSLIFENKLKVNYLSSYHNCVNAVFIFRAENLKLRNDH